MGTITHKYPLYRAYTGISYGGTLVGYIQLSPEMVQPWKRTVKKPDNQSPTRNDFRKFIVKKAGVVVGDIWRNSAIFFGLGIQWSPGVSGT